MIDISAAEQLLDLGARIGEERARSQLEGAVAIHNVLEKHNVAVLADEVGMGKTYVALGALALFRHFNPRFRVLVLAPRANIQEKWTKELRNFVRANVRFPDLRVKAVDGRSARPLTSCENLLELAHEAILDPDRDFFARLSSFSLPLGGRDAVLPAEAERMRGRLRELLPWLPDEVFDLRQKRDFKDNLARAICCALPEFDLVICDESHNLKHGFAEGVSARNRVLALAFGHPGGKADRRLFPTYGIRAKRVLFLSATPLEESFTHLWNQLDVFGLGSDFEDLRKDEIEEEEKKALASKILIRRVTTLRVNGSQLTKNLYRREWRRGGVFKHDEPIRIAEPKSRLIVALVQKKVAEVLGNERFNSSFQVGMLASFESFLETAKVKKSEEELGNFDGGEQAEDDLEKEGIDVSNLNRLARSYRERFGDEMPHPKMDAVVRSLMDAWTTGCKALVFVRRVASVRELKRKLDRAYDEWLLGRLRAELPPEARPTVDRLESRYRVDQAEARSTAKESAQEGADVGGTDTFFAWFFRGDGPRGIVSGANIQKRFNDRSGPYATFFEDNYVAALLGAQSGAVESALCTTLGMEREAVRAELQRRAVRYLSRARKIDRGDRFEAFQAAAMELIGDSTSSLSQQARLILRQRFETSLQKNQAHAAPEPGDILESPTFFTALRERPALRERLWPESSAAQDRERFHERELRRELLATAARLGHAFIDLYLLVAQHLGDLSTRAQDTERDDPTSAIAAYLDLLDRQRLTPSPRSWCAFDELSAISANFDLILDVNEPNVRTAALAEASRLFGQLLRQQQPVGGMSGEVNRTLLRQFRMPGYPFVLITTDLLQEGEDLHTFCSTVHHYGISWTPSSMEQRIGRVDRVRSQADRHLSSLARDFDGTDLLQVYFPHLEDTVEVLQVRRVLERMNTFLRLMHEGINTSMSDERRIDTTTEFLRELKPIEQIREPLRSAFPVQPELLSGPVRALAVSASHAKALSERFARLRSDLPGLEVRWESGDVTGMILGTAVLASRQQPFTLLLQSSGDAVVVRCISPVGCVDPDLARDQVIASAARAQANVAAIIKGEDERTYDLTVEEAALLGPPQHDAARISALIRRVVTAADALEVEHLPGQDELLETFKPDLEKEGDRGR